MSEDVASCATIFDSSPKAQLPALNNILRLLVFSVLSKAGPGTVSNARFRQSAASAQGLEGKENCLIWKGDEKIFSVN